MNKLIPITLILLGIVGTFAAAALLGGSFIGIFDEFNNGKEIHCDVAVDASVLGNLRIQSAQCAAVDTCHVSESLSIVSLPFQVEGDLALWQSGKIYDRVSVSESSINPNDGKYGLSACLPAETQQVRIGIINANGGIENDEVYNIN